MKEKLEVLQGDSPARPSNSNGFGFYALGDGELLQDLRMTVTYHPDHRREDRLEELTILRPVD